MLSHLFGNPDDETYPLLNRMNELFGNPNHETNPKATLPKLKEALQVLEKKEEIFTERVAESVQEAIVYALVGNKKDAIHKLRIKRFFESHIDLSINCRIVIDQQINAIYDGKATTKTVDALRAKVVEMKAMQKAMKIDEVDKQIQRSVFARIGRRYDKDELKEEFKEILERFELEEQLLQPATTTPATAVLGKQPSRLVANTNKEEKFADMVVELDTLSSAGKTECKRSSSCSVGTIESRRSCL